MSQQIHITRWPETDPPSETELQRRLAAEGLQPYRWSNAPNDVYAPHAHSYHKVIYVVQGSITFGLPDQGDSITLQAGDRLDLPAQVRHEATVGPAGVVCLEAHR